MKKKIGDLTFLTTLVSCCGRWVKRLLHLEWHDRAQSKLNNLPLLHDINCVNMNPNWREHGRLSDNYITAVCCSIKPELMFKTTLKATLPDMEDYFIALQLALKTQHLVSSFSTEFDFNSSATLIKPECLEPIL